MMVYRLQDALFRLFAAFFVCCRMIVYPVLNVVNLAFKMAETGRVGEGGCLGGMFRFRGLVMHLVMHLVMQIC